MVKEVNFENIGYQAATFKVDSTTKAALEANYLDAATQRVDVVGKNLAVKLTGNDTVGFGASSPTTADALFGIIIQYEEDGYASVQYSGFVPNVPTDGEIAVGTRTLAVNDSGKVKSVDSTVTDAIVTNEATLNNEYATIKLA